MINLKIKTNGTVRNLTLPYPGQSIPDIIEKNSVVTVSEVTEPESLKYMEGHEWNIDLAKRAKLLNPHPTHYKYPIDKPQKQRYNSYRYTLCDIYYKLLKKRKDDKYGSEEQIYKGRNGGCGGSGRAEEWSCVFNGEIACGRTWHFNPASLYLFRHDGYGKSGGI